VVAGITLIYDTLRKHITARSCTRVEQIAQRA
jgi:hypothetical protein